MSQPDGVLKHRTKGTHVIRRGENYYLYRVTSVWNREKGRAQLKTEKYLGKITPDGLIQLVGDKGFYSRNNVKELEAAHIHYILPLRKDSMLIDYGGMRSMKSFIHFLF